jgi:hypothetical protein
MEAVQTGRQAGACTTELQVRGVRADDSEPAILDGGSVMFDRRLEIAGISDAS